MQSIYLVTVASDHNKSRFPQAHLARNRQILIVRLLRYTHIDMKTKQIDEADANQFNYITSFIYILLSPSKDTELKTQLFAKN
jgi:hypothetical protein